MGHIGLVLLGGAFGALARYVLDGWVSQRLAPGLPWGTMLINLSGSFLLGLLTALSTERMLLPSHYRLLIGIGFLGSYTTFSTWQFETLRLLENGSLYWGILNLFGGSLLGLIAMLLGVVAGRTL